MLQVDCSFKGIHVSGAIAEVGSIVLNESHTTIGFQVNYRASTEAAEVFLTESYNTTYNEDNGSIVEQAYSYLKGLSQFEGALEVA